MSFDPIANGWRKLIKKETKTTPIPIEWDMAMPNGGFGMQFVKMGVIPLVEGKSYAITTDSGTFFAVCEKHTETQGLETSDYLFIGNKGYFAIADAENPEDVEAPSGESFIYCETTIPNVGAVGSGVDFNGGNTFTIAEVEKTETIDPKYLPSGGGSEEAFKVIDLSNYIADEDGNTYADVIQNLILYENGGSTILPLNNDFWEAVGANVPLLITFPMTILDTSCYSTSVTKAKGISTGAVTQVSISAVMLAATGLMDLKVIFNWTNSYTQLVVTVNGNGL